MSSRGLLLIRNTTGSSCRACGAVLPWFTRTNGDCVVGAAHQPVVVETPDDWPAGLGELVPLSAADIDPRYVWNLSEELRESKRIDQGGGDR